MLLFSRVATLRGGPRAALGWATEINECVNQLTELDVTLWTAVFGYPVGTVAWSTRVEGRAQLAAETQNLLGNDGYLDLIEKGVDLIAIPPQDSLRRLIHGEPAEEAPPVGSVATIVTATAANGRLADAIQFGIEITDHVNSTIGASGGFFADAYGTFGQLTWITGLDDMAAADAANEALMTDAGYMDRVKAGGELFLPGSGNQGLVTRLA